MSTLEEVSAVLSRFLLGVDQQDAALVRSTLCAEAETVMELDGQVLGHSEGRETIVGFLEEFWKTQVDQRRHVFSNAFLESETDDTATMVAYLTLYATKDQVLRPVATGRYRDEFAKEDDSWKIRRRFLILDGPFE